MELKIGNYTVCGDGICVLLRLCKVVKSGKTKGQENEEVIGYYPDFDQALRRLLQEEIGRSGARDVKALIAAIRSANANISRAVNRLYLDGRVE